MLAGRALKLSNRVRFRALKLSKRATEPVCQKYVYEMLVYYVKNAAKRSRQHAGKRYREYVQRHVCFVNEQVP